MKKVAVVHIFYDKTKDRFLVEHRNKDQFLANKMVFPGGKVELGEFDDYTKTLIREAEEEFGVKILTWVKLLPEVVGINGFKLHCYFITKWNGNIPKLSLDHGNRLEWIDRNKFRPSIIPIKHILKIVNDYVVQCY